MSSVGFNYLNDRITPWDKPSSDFIQRTARVVEISIMVVSILALVSPLIVLGISHCGVHIPQLSRIFVFTLAYPLIVVGATLVGGVVNKIIQKAREGYAVSRELKVEANWIHEQKEQSGGKVFTVNDPAPNGLAWNHPGKKRVLIVTSEEGGGHKTAFAATKKALEDADYDVYKSVPGRLFDQNKWYNYCQKKGWNRIQRRLVNMQSIGEWMNSFEIMNRAIRRDIYQYKPQMVISVQPISNGFIEKEASKLSIPFTLLTTDFYCRHFLYGSESPK